MKVWKTPFMCLKSSLINQNMVNIPLTLIEGWCPLSSLENHLKHEYYYENVTEQDYISVRS